MPPDPGTEMLRRMWLIRAFDEAAARLVSLGEIAGAIHLTTGQEGEVVGACMALEERDYVTGNHRGHGHPIAKGAAPGPLMAELMGKETGVCRGRGGSMHVADPAVNNLAGSAILGSGLPLAVGFALAAQVKGEDRVSLVFFGEGASSEGATHEAMNLASIWRLPVVFLCENNGYQVTVSARDSLSVADVASRAQGYGMPGAVVDGQDAIAVRETVSAAVERARRGGGPSLVEAKTYRFSEHAENLPIPPYRDEAEVEAWRARDPIPLLRDRLVAAGVLAEADAAAIEAGARAEIDQAVAFARESPWPEADAVFDALYANPAGFRHA
jgi:pyruvate dehydrogenase E1 component alpha subunit